jgi:thiamine kinase-like enzyme
LHVLAPGLVLSRLFKEFHLWLREGLQPSEVEGKENDQDWQDIREMAMEQDGPRPALVFTHFDLSPFNILIREDQVVGIID